MNEVPILKLGEVLVVSIQAALTDTQLEALQEELARRVGPARGLILDVSAQDVLDSYATRLLLTIIKIAALRGTVAIIVGIQPDVAFAMVQLGVTLDGVPTALDLDDGLALLERKWGDA